MSKKPKGPTFDKILDWRGTEMTVGSIVVFPVSFGRGSMMKEGVVVSIEHAIDSYSGKLYYETVRSHLIDDPDRPGYRKQIIDEQRPVYKIGVKTIKYGDGNPWHRGDRWWETNNSTERPSYPHPDRITVVNPRVTDDLPMPEVP